MNRIITFRGKLKDAKGWISGGYAFDTGKTYIIHPITLTECRSFEFVEVDPDTVGQFTGLTDKNGAGIYEGDILSAGLTVQGTHIAWPVVFHFDGWKLGNDKWAPSRPNKCLWKRCEIIGNVHQHPHLLKQNQ